MGQYFEEETDAHSSRPLKFDSRPILDPSCLVKWNQHSQCLTVHEKLEPGKDIHEEFVISPKGHVPISLLARALNLALVMGVMYKDGDGYTNANGKVKNLKLRKAVQAKATSPFEAYEAPEIASPAPITSLLQVLLARIQNREIEFQEKNLALRKDSDESFLSNVEDTDEMFDGLFNKYGKVVFRSNDNKPPTAEVDDDAESLSFAVEMAKVASDVKASDIRVLFVKPLVYWTRFFIIATAFSRPQIDAINSRMRDLAEKKYGRVSTGDTKPNSWTLLDFGDVVIHIFLPPQREFYNLEEFYGNATLIELPFENQPPLGR
ncbi:hypothetical protein OIU84_003183 [Salix udensis]|uniref:Protein Iojap, chloroplastic n=1 Tax=Salix udensis TaxID=889485 RepID=A0AAD6K807_9ROSI|nr:hypothetical protein OIU84_003183 [Salix udensis]